jgi:thiamine kinase-like enzyme
LVFQCASLLTESGVVNYLLGRGLLTGESVCSSDLTVSDRSRRNSNFSVSSSVGPSFFIKHAIGRNTEALANEAAFYMLVQSDPRLQELRPLLVRCYDFDSENNVLILELLRDGKDLEQYHRRHRFPLTLAKRQGAALGVLHRLTKSWADSRSKQELPWAFSFGRPTVNQLRQLRPAGIQIVKIIQRYPEYNPYLDLLASDWSASCVIHGDFKWANCLALALPGSKRKSRIKVLDWELARLGDPCWDLAGAFGAYLGLWASSVPILEEKSAQECEKISGFSLECMYPAMRSFWHTYSEHACIQKTQQAQMLERTVRYLAVRLIQTAVEQAQNGSKLTTAILSLLQLSQNIIRRPEQARGLLGM